MKRSSLFVSIILCLALLLSLGATGVFAAEEGQEAAFVKNWGMTLNDEIVLKFEMGEIPAGATEIKATVGGRTYTAPASQQIVSVPVYATQMTEAVTLAAVDADGAAVASRSFTVLAYLQSVLDNALFASYHPLVKELLNYGRAAQLHFIGSSDITVSGAGQMAIPSSASVYAIDDQSDLLDCTGASLVYREKIALRFYFDVDPTGCTFAVNGEAAELTINEEGKYVELADILPQNLDQQVVLSVTDAEDNAVSVTYSPLTYIVRMSQKGSSTTKALVKALYNYHLAAKAFVPLQDFVVSFNVGHDGESFEDRTIAVGDPYGQLPVPADRVGYTFGGWYTDAACTGEAVTAETLVTSSHTLYAKWSVIEDPNSVTVGSTINGSDSIVHSYVEDKHLYTFSTSGVSGQWGRGVFIGAPEAAGFVVVEFRFTEAKAADGTEFAPSLGVLRNGEGNGGQYIASVAIYDENGTQVAASNNQTGLTVGQWYTAVIKTINTKTLELYAAHNRTDDPSVKMEIRDRAFVTSVPIVGGAANGYYAHAIPVTAEEDPTYAVIVNSRGDGTNEVDRRLTVSVGGDKLQIISMKVNITACTGTPALHVLRSDALPVGYAITDSEGNIADSKNLKQNEWYTLTWIAEHISLTSYRIDPFLGSAVNGTILVKDISVKDLEGPVAGTYYTWAAPVADNGTYMCYSFPTGDGTSIGYRQINVTVDAASGDLVSANVMIKNTTGTPKFIVRNAAGAELATIIKGSDGNEIDSTAMELGEWYTISWIADGSATYQFLSFEGTAVNGTYFVKDIKSEAVALNYSFTYGADVGQYYATATKVLFEGDIAYKCVVNSRGDGTNDVLRRVHLNVANSAKQVISMQVYFESCTNTPSIRLHRGDGMASNAAFAVDYFVTDAEGNLCDSHNLELNKWYTVTWLAAGVADYMVMPFEGSATNGTYYVKDVTVADVTGAFASTYYVWVAPYAVGNDTNYFIRARYITDPTDISHRNITFNTSAASGDVISMKMMMTETSGTPDLQVKNAGGTAMNITVLDENGNGVSAADMQLNKWYTVSWTADGSASYSLCTFQGTAANGSYFVKDITVEEYVSVGYSVSFDLNYDGATNAPATITVAEGNAYGELPTATREGYTFEGWTLEDGTLVNAETAVSASHTLYAKWSIDKTGVNYSLVYGSDGSYYTTLTETVFEGEFAYKLVVNSRGDGTNNIVRRVHLNVTDGTRQAVSMKVYFAECTNTPSIVVWRGDGMANNIAYSVDYVVTDDAGNVYDPHNLELGKWYNVTFVGAGIGNYMLWFFEGSATNGTVYVKDVTPITNTGAFTTGYYMTVAPYVAGNDTNYAVFARYITDATGINDRAIAFNVDAASGDIISMKVQMPRTSGTPDLIIKNAGGSAMSTAITDANCNIISAAQMQLGQWYTVSWTADGSASYTLCAFQGSAANGACLVKDIAVTAAPANPFYVPEGNESLVDNVGYYGKVVPVVLGDEVAYMHYIHPTGDGTNQVNRRAALEIANDARQAASMQVYFASCTGTPYFEIKRDDGYAVDYIITDAEGNVVASSDLELNKWYTVTWITVGAGIKYRIQPMMGSAANGTYYMKNITVTSLVDPITPSYYVTAASFAAGEETHYWVRARDPGADGTQISNRNITLKINSASSDVISFKMKMTQTTGTPDLQIKNAAGTAMAFTVGDAEGNIVAATDMQLGQWYTVSWVSDGSASYNIYSFAGLKANGTYFVKNITVTPAPEDAPTLIAQTPSYLTEATAEQLTEAGITDATGTVYRFTKAAGLEGGAGKAGAIWLENRNGDAYVTFDFYYGAFSNLSLPSVGYAHSGPYLLLNDGASFYKPNENGVTIVEKGTGTSAETYVHNGTSTVYIKLAQQTWYTITMPVANISRLYMPVNTTDSATMFITNIVWSDAV